MFPDRTVSSLTCGCSGPRLVPAWPPRGGACSLPARRPLSRLLVIPIH